MYTKTALEHFNNSRMAIARILNLSKSAVYQWEEIVPHASAERLQKITGGKLKVDRSLYSEKTLAPIRNNNSDSTAAA